jgi:hypothetical protein
MYAERALMLLAIARATAGFVVLRAPPLRSLHGGHISRGYLDRHRSGSCLYTMMAGAKAGDKVTVSRVVGRDRKGGGGVERGEARHLQEREWVNCLLGMLRGQVLDV